MYEYLHTSTADREHDAGDGSNAVPSNAANMPADVGETSVENNDPSISCDDATTSSSPRDLTIAAAASSDRVLRKRVVSDVYE